MIGMVWSLGGLAMIGSLPLYFYSATAFVMYWVIAFLASIATRAALKRSKQVDWDYESRAMEMPGVSLLVPAFNEEKTIDAMIRSIQSLQYPRLQVVIINDGSTDGTMELVYQRYQLQPAEIIPVQHIYTQDVYGVYQSQVDSRILFIDKKNGGKADALNCGINYAEHDLFCAIDADSVLGPDALTHLVYPFRTNEHMVAAGGNIRIMNGSRLSENAQIIPQLSRKPIEVMQVVEYVRNMMSRMAFMRMRGLAIISGAFGLFRKDLVIEVGGYQVGLVGEDMELVVRLHRWCLERNRRYKIIYVPDAVCWTEGPASLNILFKQRNRWQRGLLETFFLHKRMLFRPRFRMVGMVSLPYIFITGILSPFIEVAGFLTVIGMLIHDPARWNVAIWGFVFASAMTFFLTSLTISIETDSVGVYLRTRQLLWLYLHALFENVWYQPLMVWPRLIGTIDYFRVKVGWGKMTRIGIPMSSRDVNFVQEN